MYSHSRRHRQDDHISAALPRNPMGIRELPEWPIVGQGGYGSTHLRCPVCFADTGELRVGVSSVVANLGLSISPGATLSAILPDAGAFWLHPWRKHVGKHPHHHHEPVVQGFGVANAFSCGTPCLPPDSFSCLASGMRSLILVMLFARDGQGIQEFGQRKRSA